MIDTETACNMLHEIQKLNPKYKAPKKHSTFLVTELSENEDGVMELTTSIIDPGVPDEGDAKAYLALLPQQRAMLELTHIINEVTPGLAAVARQAPLDKRILKFVDHNLPRLCGLMRELSIKAAVSQLTESRTDFDISVKADVTIGVPNE